MRKLLLPLIGVAAIASAFTLRADKVAFKPTDGKQLARSYQIDLDLSIGDFSMVVNGQDMSEMMGEPPPMTAKFLMDVTDSFVKSQENRQLELIRSYDAMEMEVTADGDSNSPEGLDKLQGKKVRFVWNEEEGDYDVAFHEGEGEEDVLKVLGADMDLIALLPTREVSVGDKWTVDAKHIFPVLLYGSAVERMEGGDGDDVAQMVQEALADQFAELAKGFTLTCEYKGRRDAESVGVAAIGLKLSGDGKILLADVIEDIASQQVPPEVEVDFSIETAEMSMKIDGEGELLWNVAGGHLQTYDMTSKMGMEFQLEATVSAQGETQEISFLVEIDGNGTWKVRPR